MINKLKQVKNELKTQLEILSEKELRFISGGARAAAGSSGTGSGSTQTNCCCDKTTVHCCLPPIDDIKK